MHLDDLTSLLQQVATGQGHRTAACPDEHQTAAYVDGALEPKACEELELHLADCEACAALVGLLSRQRDVAATEPVPELALARARGLGKAGPDRWRRYAPHWAVAATVLIAISALLHFTQVQLPGIEPQITPEQRVTRSIPSLPPLRVLSPSAGMTVEAKELVFRWTTIPGSRYYDVRIVTEAGELVSEQRVADTEWRPTDKLDLRPGAEYFVRIAAYPSEANIVSSDHVPFSIAKRH